MADKRISQLVDRGTVVNNDVIPIVVSGATTTNKATISSIQTFMQGNLDLGVTSVGITIGSTGTDVNVSGSPVTSSGNITINIPSASATNRGLVTTGSQTFAGAKTFNSDLIVNGITVGKGGASNGNNTAIGANSLSSNTTGTLNTATGISSLQYNTGGNSNTANGANSLVSNTTGGFNTASGNQSLYSNTTGQANTAIGLNSLYSNTTGTYNIGVGSGAGYYIADGSTPNTTSDLSIYLGADTKASIDGAQNEVVIGYNAIGNGSNTVTIGNSSNTENYFTGNVRGLSFQVAAAGTANPIIIRNTSGTSSTTSNTNVIGFNSVNNIFVTTHSRGGFILGFNNSVSNREYTLPDASGTVALTSDLTGFVTLATTQTITAQKTFTTSGGSDSVIITTTGAGFALDAIKAGNGEVIRVNKTSGTGNAMTVIGGNFEAPAIVKTSGTSSQFLMADGSVNTSVLASGAYLPLAGGTLTGALNGTSASFTGAVGAASLSGAFATLSNYGSATSTALQLGDANNGLFRPALNSVAIATNGSAALTLASTGAATFSGSVSVKGGLTIVRSNTSESSIISNEGNLIYNARDNFNHVFQSNGSEVARINTTGAATFSSSVTAGGNIVANKNNSTDLQLILNQQTSGYACAVNLVAATDSGAIYNYISSGTSGATAMWQIGGGATANTMVMYTGGTERMRITSDGYLRMAASTGGIQFNGDTAAANALDDYEEGTWTPVVKIGATVNTATATIARYTKIGNIVYIQATITGITKSGTGDLTISGLPFTVGSAATFGDTQATLRWDEISSSGVIYPYFNEGSTIITMQDFSTTGYNGTINNTQISSSYQLYGISGFYMV